jgi:hypothetical protein
LRCSAERAPSLFRRPSCEDLLPDVRTPVQLALLALIVVMG